MGVWFSLCGGYAVVTCLANVGVFRSDWEACSAEAVRRQAVADVSAAVEPTDSPRLHGAHDDRLPSTLACVGVDGSSDPHATSGGCARRSAGDRVAPRGDVELVGGVRAVADAPDV